MQPVALAVLTCFPGQTALRKVGDIGVLECEHDEGSCGVIANYERSVGRLTAAMAGTDVNGVFGSVSEALYWVTSIADFSDIDGDPAWLSETALAMRPLKGA